MKGLPLERVDHFSLHSPAIVYACSALGDFPATFISKNVTRILGHKPFDFINTPRFWVDHIHPDEVESILSGLAALFENGFHHHEYRFRALDGTYKWFRDDLSLVRDESGNPMEAIGCMVDITAEKELEFDKMQLEELRAENAMNELRLSQIQARLADRERLLQDMHDGFGSQLASAKLMASQGLLGVDKFESVINDCILDLHLVCDTLALDASSIFDAIVNLKYRIARYLEGSNISLNWDIQLNQNLLLESTIALNILRILQEAIANALRHSKAKNIDINASFYEVDGAAHLLFSIQDDGVGLVEGFRLGRGIQNMKSRAHKINGNLKFSNEDVAGVAITLEVPVKKPL
jgi:PAS domain S-box-containing protein